MELIENAEFSLWEIFAGSDSFGLKSTLFEDSKFYTIPATASDRTIDLPSLSPGEVVCTTNFNGVYVEKIPKKEDYDVKKKEVCEYIAAVYQAFDRDCPEIFWLSGKCKVRIMTVTNQDTGVKEAYFFLVLADKDGFTMCSPSWIGEGNIRAGVQRRDAAAENILAAITAGDTVGRVKELNRWLTEHNQYNTTADLTTIGNEPHECLAALEGRVGTDGPVCDGYSRAFKLLCDRLEIPCVLETGWAQATTSSTSEFHMWANVQVGTGWYGVDVTWDDPVVKDFVGPKSGHENENFLLVGADTVVLGRAFQTSHVVKNQAAAGGVDFHNGPVLSATALQAAVYGGLAAELYSDVAVDYWAADAIAWAKNQGYMVGVTPSAFGPENHVTRQQIWIVLARLAGELPASGEEARAWAAQVGVTDGSNLGRSASRQEAVTFLYRYAKAQGGALEAGTDLAAFRDAGEASSWAREALEWAAGSQLVRGTAAGYLSPKGMLTRAQFAAILQRFCKSSGQF